MLVAHAPVLGESGFAFVGTARHIFFVCVGDDSPAGSGALNSVVLVMHHDVVVRRPHEVSAAAFILLQVMMSDFTITRDETETIIVQSLHVSHPLESCMFSSCNSFILRH